MPSIATPHRAHSFGSMVAAALLVLLLPLSASAHSELKTSDPADGASVPASFSGPVVLTFSEALADGSKADLVGPDGSTVAAATIDAGAATMTFSLTAALAAGDYQVKWTSIATDGDLLRGIVTFSVAAPVASSTPEASITVAPSTPATNPPGSTATAAGATPAASPASSSDPGGGSDVILPIVIALIVAAAGAFYLVRRNRPA